MYLPAHFKPFHVAALHALIRAWPLATVVMHGENGLLANHLPLELVELEDDMQLHGHMASTNELALMNGAHVLAIFHGPDGYVSPAWYCPEHAAGNAVPTWNYAVAHVHGQLRVVTDDGWLRRLLERQVDHYEAQLPKPWRVSDMSADAWQRQLHAIVGLEISIDRIEGKFKLSQNRSTVDRVGVIRGLRARLRRTDDELANLMAQQEGAGHER